MILCFVNCVFTIQGPCYLSRDDHDQKIRARKQRTGIEKYSFVNSPIKHWDQLPAEMLLTFLCRSHVSRKRFRTVIVRGEVKGSDTWG